MSWVSAGGVAGLAERDEPVRAWGGEVVLGVVADVGEQGAEVSGPLPVGKVPDPIAVQAADLALARAVADQQAKIDTYPQRLAEANAKGRGINLGLDIHNRPPAGRAHVFTIDAGHHTRAVNRTPVADLSVKESFDDGKTWTDARVVGEPKDTWDTGGPLPAAEPYQQFRVVLKIPPLHRTNGFVTLRVKAEDANGGTVDQTIRRAYILKQPDTRRQSHQGPNHRN